MLASIRLASGASRRLRSLTRQAATSISTVAVAAQLPFNGLSTRLSQHDQMKEATISAVICTRNRPDLIPGAVQSVLENDDANFELLVIDQSDSNSTRDALVHLFGDTRLRYVHTTKVGLSAAYNAAVQQSRGELFAFTDDDCIAPANWVHSFRTEFEKEQDVDLIYGQVHAPQRLSCLPGVVPVLPFPERKRISARDGFFVSGMGANFGARKRAFRIAGGFDEVLGGGGELRSSQDFDFQFRLFRAAGVSVLTPDIQVEHLGHRTPEQWRVTMRAYGVGDGAFYMKHVRCGDLLAGRLLVSKLVREAAKVVLFPFLRRRRQPTEYLAGLLEGTRKSFGFGVDRDARVYVAR